MRICIYGAGAMGTSLGALMTRQNIACDLVSRNRAHIVALKEKGAILIGRAETQTPVNALLPEEMSGKYDIIFLATKQRENRQIAESLKEYLAEDGALVSVQNGLPEAELAEIVGEERVYGCALGWGAQLEAPGVVRLTSEEFHLSLGAYGSGRRHEEIAALLERGVAFTTVGNLCEIRYSKLAVNAAFSTLSAISGLTFGELAQRHKKLVLRLVREVIAVAKAYGCKQLMQNGHDILKLFSNPFAVFILPMAMKKHREIRSGMLRDLQAGRRCDVDFVAGACVKAGEKKGISCPNLSRAVALVHDIENGLAEIAPESLELI